MNKINPGDFTDEEKSLIMLSINRSGTGEHPICDGGNISYFTATYAKDCVRRTLNSNLLNEEGTGVAKTVLGKLNEATAKWQAIKTTLNPLCMEGFSAEELSLMEEYINKYGKEGGLKNSPEYILECMQEGYNHLDPFNPFNGGVKELATIIMAKLRD